MTRRRAARAASCARRSRCPTSSARRSCRPRASRSARCWTACPPYFSQAAITPDRRAAVLAFGLRLGSLEAQHEVIEEMRARLNPPAGVTRDVAGLPVLAADANHALSDPLRRVLPALAGLVAVALALFAVYRSWARAWVPLVPIALATGWSALVLWLLGVPLNPMSAALSALVIAISTEFSVLLSARYREERETGSAGRGAGAHVRLHRRRRAGLRRDRDRGLRRPDRLRHRDAARLRPGHRDRPRGLAARGARRPARRCSSRPSARGAPRPRAPPRSRRRGMKAAPGCCSRCSSVALLGWVTFNSVATETAGSKGLQAGDPLPPFAMPLSTSTCRGAATRTSRRRPIRARRARSPRARCAGRRCSTRASWPRAGRSCSRSSSSRSRAAGPDPGARAGRRAPPRRQVPGRRRARGRGDRRSLRSNLPVGYDHDGAVANEYAVVVCPTITFVRAAGGSPGSTVGPLGEAGDRGWVGRH